MPILALIREKYTFMNNSVGKLNIAVGLSVMAGFMVYGFVLIYLRDFSPAKEA
jgi:hypothetical protein